MFELQNFETALKEALLVHSDKRVLLACSGGVDSVLLAHALKKVGICFGLAHMNFGLRGRESEGDAEFVSALGQQLQVEVHSKAVVLNTERSIQQEARTLRYEWFEFLRRRHHYDAIATAHHLDDSIEGMLMSVFTGANLNRLSGISDHSCIIRPLQRFTKTQLLNYARAKNLTYREDSSNQRNDYLRNYVRNSVVKELELRNPDSKSQLISSLDWFKEQKALRWAYREQLEETLCTSLDTHTDYNITGLTKLNPLDAHVKLLFEPYGFTDYNAIVRLLNAENGKSVLSSAYRLVKFDRSLLLASIDTPKAVFRASFYPHSNEGSKNNEMIYQLEVREDLEESAQLSVRLWHSEDVILLKGKQNPKKVSKLLRDLKIDPITKSRVHVLCYNDQLLAVLGYKIDDRFVPLHSEKSKIIQVWHELL